LNDTITAASGNTVAQARIILVIVTIITRFIRVQDTVAADLAPTQR
jgi:hypothetical protein